MLVPAPDKANRAVAIAPLAVMEMMTFMQVPMTV
jgi:hypothetical protein